MFGNAAQVGFRRAYNQIRIDERKYLRQVQRAHRLPIQSWSDMFHLGPQVIDPIAHRTIKSASRMAGLEGMGLGFGGFLGRHTGEITHIEEMNLHFVDLPQSFHGGVDQ